MIENEFTEEWSYQEMEGLPEGELGLLFWMTTNLQIQSTRKPALLISLYSERGTGERHKVKIRLKEQVITFIMDDEVSDVSPEDVEFETTVIKKVLSNNDYLKSLNVTNGTLVPSFNKNTVNYTVSVPYSITKLQFTALCEDEKYSSGEQS